MPEFVIDVIVNPARAVPGARTVRKELERAETAAEKLGQRINRAFTGVAAGALIVKLVQLGDQYTNLQNRLRTVTDSQADLVTSSAELLDIANETRQSFTGTAEVYTRVATSAEELGRTQEELLGFTESLNQAVALSGATATEARAGLIQLAQGIAAGALRGEELNAVLEQLPVVADVIAKSLGVTRGELKALGQEGKITADIVLDAFAESREELATRFAEAVPTVGQAFTVLGNNVLAYVGQANEATGASNSLASAVLALADNLETVVAVATTAGVAFAAIRFGPAIAGASEAAAAFIKFRVAVLSGNAVVLGSAVAATQQAAAEVAATQAVIAKTTATIAQIEAETAKAVVLVGSAEASFAQAAIDRQLVALNAQRVAATEALTAAQTRLATATAASTLRARALAALGNPFVLYTAGAVALGFAIDEVLDQLVELEAKSLKATEAGEKFQLTEFGKAGADVLRVQENLARVQAEIDRDLTTRGFANPVALQLAERYTEQLETLVGVQQRLADGTAHTTVQAREQQAALDKLAGSLDGVIRNIGEENDLLLKNARERGIQAELLKQIAELEEKGGPKVSATQRALLEQAIRGNVALQERADVLDRIQGPTAEFERDLAILNHLLGAGTITQQQFNAEVERMAAGLDDVDLQKLDLSKLLSGGGSGEVQAILERLRAQLGQIGEGQEFIGPKATAGDELRADLFEQIRGPAQEFAAVQQELNTLLESGAISAEQYTIAINEAAIASNTLGSSATAGLKAGLAQVQNQLLDVAGAVQGTVVNAFGRAEDAIVEFATTGKVDFSAFVDGLLADVARILARQALLGLLNLFTGGAAAGADSAGGLLGGLLGGFGGAKAGGGDVDRDRSYLVGEEGAEIFTPDQAGQITPAGETAARLEAGARGQQAPTVNVSPPAVNVFNITDKDEIPAGIESREGEQAVMNVIRRNRRTARGMLSS